MNHKFSFNEFTHKLLVVTIIYVMWMDVMLWLTPPRGVTGDVMKMRLAKSYTSFHAIPQGKWDASETVGCGWHQRSRILCRRTFMKDHGCLQSQATIKYAVGRFRERGIKIPLVPWSKKIAGIIIHLLFRVQDFETFWDPPTFPCLDDAYNVVVFFCPTVWIDYHDDVTYWWIPPSSDFSKF